MVWFYQLSCMTQTSLGFPLDFSKWLGTQVLVTSFEAGVILTTLYIFQSNFGPNKEFVLRFSFILEINLDCITIPIV